MSEAVRESAAKNALYSYETIRYSQKSSDGSSILENDIIAKALVFLHPAVFLLQNTWIL